jgi:hypothetical protein
MGSSQFEFTNNLDERVKAREVILEEFKERLLNDYKAAVKEFAGNQNLIKIDSLITGGLRILFDEYGGK